MNLNDSEAESFVDNIQNMDELVGATSPSLRSLPDNDANSFAVVSGEVVKNIIIV